MLDIARDFNRLSGEQDTGKMAYILVIGKQSSPPTEAGRELYQSGLPGLLT
jgi:hypothetical protein